MIIVLDVGGILIYVIFWILFDNIDVLEGVEVKGLDKKVYWNVIDECYLCDMCYTKCPYVPPHEF